MAERGERVAVMRVVVDAQWCPVLEDDARRALDLNRDEVGRILEPADFKLLPIQRAGLDGGAVVVRDQLALRIAAADAHALVRECLRPRLVAGGDEVGRPAVDRDVKLGAGKARAGNHRLEIAGEQSGGLAKARDPHRLEIFFEKTARRLRILRREAQGLAADGAQGAADRSLLVALPAIAQHAAARLVGGKCREVIIGRPAGELRPCGRLELRAGKFQRLVRRCSADHRT